MDLFDRIETNPTDRPAPEPLPDPARCDCGGAYASDAHLEGETCGGLHRVGWLVCQACGATCVTRRGRTEGAWTLASSGRSVDAGGVRLRGDGDGAAAVMARLVRLPELESIARAAARGEDVRERAMASIEGAP